MEAFEKEFWFKLRSQEFAIEKLKEAKIYLKQREEKKERKLEYLREKENDIELLALEDEIKNLKCKINELKAD